MLVQTVSVLLLSAFVCAEELPFPKCSRSDPNFNACLLKAMDESTLILAKGIPSLKIPPTEPLKIDNIEINQGGDNARFNMKSSYKDIQINGLTSSKMLRTAIKFDKFKIKSETLTNRLEMISNYNMNGQILFLPIQGQGKANISMHQVTARHELTGEYFIKPEDGQTYINITEYKIKFKPKSVTFKLDNLFNGDKVLGDTMNAFMNQNWKNVFNAFVPDFEKFFGAKFSKIANKVFQKVPMKDIFLD